MAQSRDNPIRALINQFTTELTNAITSQVAVLDSFDIQH